MSLAYETPTLEQDNQSNLPPRRPRRSRRGWLAAVGLTAILVLGAAGAETFASGAPGQQLVSTLFGEPTVAAAAPSTAPVQDQSDPRLAAIQQVIQRGNSEQAQAIASQDSSVMSDTSTPAYLQQMTQVNQQMAAQGVTGIQLTNLSWGPISVDGTSATAQTTETWVTTFSDGTTMQSTDANTYTLQQQQQDGSWLISNDQQPNSNAPAGAAATSPGTPSQPRSTTPPSTGVDPIDSNNTSRNWSGYAATGQTYTAVSGTWTVPQPSLTGDAGVGATWVGIGGVNSRDLIQAGTQDVASGTGQSQFQAWIEMLPQASHQVPLAVAPGDSVTVSITESSPGSGMWTIDFKNNTSGQAYQTNVRYTSSQSSAEWIEEAPASGNGIVPLDNFGTVPFTSATAVANGQTVDLSQAGAKPITMVNAQGQALAVPSGIGSDGATFSVGRTSASATPPPTRRGFGSVPGVGGVTGVTGIGGFGFGG